MGAKVVRSRVRGPVIGKGAELIDALVGPFTSIGNGVRVHRSSVDHSIIMDGSTVEDIPRLEDLVVGRRVSIRPWVSRLGALALMVGDDCVIELSRGKNV